MARKKLHVFATQDSASAEMLPIVRLWILRILVLLSGQKELLTKYGFSNDGLALGLGLEKWVDSETTPYDAPEIRIEMRRLHAQAELELSDAAVPDPLRANITKLAHLVNLSEVDQRIVEFAVLLHTDRALEEAADLLGYLNNAKVSHVLATILMLPVEVVRHALGGQSALTHSGLVSMDRRSQGHLNGKLDLLSNSFGEKLTAPGVEPTSLLREMVLPSAPAELSLDDYAHLGESLDVMRVYLRQALDGKKKGVNVFLHGESGTGKSQLAKVIARDMGCELFEITSENESGDPIGGERRLRAFRAAQRFFGNQRVLMAFDEVEDVFNDREGAGERSTAQTRKAWVNRSLEENTVPTIWLSNSIHGVDPAFIRRFDLVLKVPVPSRKLRENILRNACGSFTDEATVRRIAESDALAPAVMTRSAMVAKFIQDQRGQAAGASALELLINSTLESQGHPKLRKQSAVRLPEVYDTRYIQADADLAAVGRGISATKAGRLCLYGPPGTGKTAYGRWLAEQMGVTLLVKRASELNSMWVGETEKNIAKAFEEAEEMDAILMIDEVDSFLRDRRGAQRSWEVAQVNEMLTQIESFSGIFIASTNLMDGLDQAALRRFDLKVRFDYLSNAQAQALFTRYCEQLGLGEAGAHATAQMATMRQLTPGDFAAVVRQSRFRPVETPHQLIEALRAECAVKEGGNRQAIGFIA